MQFWWWTPAVNNCLGVAYHSIRKFGDVTGYFFFGILFLFEIFFYLAYLIFTLMARAILLDLFWTAALMCSSYRPHRHQSVIVTSLLLFVWLKILVCLCRVFWIALDCVLFCVGLRHTWLWQKATTTANVINSISCNITYVCLGR